VASIRKRKQDHLSALRNQHDGVRLRAFRSQSKCEQDLLRGSHWRRPSRMPAPVHAHFIVSVDDVACSKLMTKEFSLVLSNPDDKGFSLFGPVSIADPDFVVARARYLDVLIDFAAVSSALCGRRIPFAFATLRPFGRHARTIHAHPRGLCSREIHPGRILDRFAIRLGSRSRACSRLRTRGTLVSPAGSFELKQLD